jgi:capsular exopolysaccharide synthesis family protein
MKKDFENISYTQTQIQTPDEKKLYEHRVVTAFKSGRWVQSCKMLRTRVLQLMNSHQWNSLAVTSVSHQAGSSLTSVNLAISIAMELDQTVLLVDANLNTPGIHKLLDLKASTGLGDYLLHDTPLDELLINPNIERLVVLPAGQPLINSTEMLRSPKMVDLVEEFKNRYPGRIIIFDMPPLLTQADALSFSPYVDSVLLIVDEGHTKIEELKYAATLLKNIEVLGTVFNKTTDNKIQFDEV